MGILDEAIREHLELKRKHGAREVEVRNLENEAFGSPLRAGEMPAAAPEEPAEATASEDAATGSDAPGSLEASAEALPGVAAPAPALGETQEHALPDLDEPAEPESAEQESAEQGSAEQESAETPPVFESTAPSAAGKLDDYEPPEPPTPPPPGTEERPQAGMEPPADPGVEPVDDEQDQATQVLPDAPDRIGESLSVITEGESPLADFYDFDDGAELADELEVDLGDEQQDAEPGPQPSDSEDAPQEATYEETAEAEAGDEGELPPLDESEPALEEPALEESQLDDELQPPPPMPDEAAPPFGGPAEPQQGESGGQEAVLYDVDGDVLEETPEFLQETPENEDLWFEQRPPKDFDFDD
jgi:hypothetical protein